MKPASISDYREAARRRLPRFLFDYIDGGAFDEETLRRNQSDLRAVALRQRVLAGAAEIDLTTDLFGEQLAMPIALGPIGLAGLTARRGEVQAARAAEKAGIPFCLSTVSACALDEVRAGVARPFWFQLYMIRDRGFMADLIAQASAVGVTRLVFTVDMPVPGTRYRDYRSGLAGAPGLMGDIRRVGQALWRPDWAYDVGLRGRPHALGNVAPVLGPNSGLDDFFAWMRGNFDPTVTWKDLEWVRDNWQGPLILKGVLDPHDAEQAVALGADGLIVSNHGGRQLDGALSTARALPSVVAAVDGRITVMADGGIRSGLDVLRMMALGADAVLLGRAWAFALAAGGEAGVTRVLELMAAEMSVAMTLTGLTSIPAITRDAIDFRP
jgi:L-lactate dehydrogenase (cytochrome)